MDTPNTPARSLAQSSRDEEDHLPGRRPKVRGRKYRDLANTFLDHFPLGTKLTTAEFDTWAQQQDLYKVPQPPSSDHTDTPEESAKQEAAYAEARLAMLQRRHIWRKRLNTAATHPYRKQEPGGPYAVERLRGEILEVRQPYVAISQNHLAVRVVSFTETAREYLEWLIHSQDWSQLPEYERIFGEGLYADISIFHDGIQVHARGLQNKFDTFRERIKRGIANGTLQPVNAAMKAIAEGRVLQPPVVQHDDAMPDDEPEEESYC